MYSAINLIEKHEEIGSRVSPVKRIKVILVGAGVLVAMLLAIAFPGFAWAQEPITIFVPPQTVGMITTPSTGATAACTGGPRLSSQ